ncbi:hypothetical protein BDM02DRAFT_2537404 [Thelephora ganbajun]|uniref:Uncharacterized protein n=1 Tax=Thelephora ganbajun TaxID=370292 RepID=A0ACB6ZDI1_THEGA|nr:hypothetical protein BDM02DRAFT_2537404 [Thelephora ganbajun]
MCSPGRPLPYRPRSSPLSYSLVGGLGTPESGVLSDRSITEATGVPPGTTKDVTTIVGIAVLTGVAFTYKASITDYLCTLSRFLDLCSGSPNSDEHTLLKIPASKWWCTMTLLDCMPPSTPTTSSTCSWRIFYAALAGLTVTTVHRISHEGSVDVITRCTTIFKETSSRFV